MRKFKSIIPIAGLLIVLALGACQPNAGQMETELQKLYDNFRFQEAREKIERFREEGGRSEFVDSIDAYIRRYSMEYPMDRAEVAQKIREKGVNCSDEWLDRWEQAGQLEYRLIDGQKRYFKNAVYNLFLLNDSLRQVAGLEGLNQESLGRFCVDHLQKVLTEYDSQEDPGLLHPVKMILDYNVKVDSGVVPEGEKISAWLPFAARDVARQTDVNLIRTRPEDAVISPEKCAHQSVYLEQLKKEAGPVNFSMRMNLTGHARYVSPQKLQPIGFSELPDSVRPYVRERAPHVIFSKDIRQLADSLVDEQMGPYQMVKTFYYWINDHIPWASAVEYGLIKNIPQYTLKHGHGDCGMQTLLFMTLCRYKGIPARWQSGWMLHPGHVNLHDWCEVWYPGVGWVPVDVSFKLQKSDNPRIREFYISGIDAFRLVVNKDYGRSFCPAKKWPRSEPWDFQRGELEWKSGNLYFDQWSWNMDVQYIH